MKKNMNLILMVQKARRAFSKMKAETSFIGIKVDKDLHEAIKAKAQLERMNVSDLLRRAIVEYLNKDINVSNEILGTMEQINKNVKKCNDQYVLFHSLFLHFLKYYFAINKSEMDKWKSPDGNRENTLAVRNTIMKTGAEYRDMFVSNFGNENKHLRKLIDTMLLDFMTEPAAADNTSSQVVQ